MTKERHLPYSPKVDIINTHKLSDFFPEARYPTANLTLLLDDQIPLIGNKQWSVTRWGELQQTSSIDQNVPVDLVTGALFFSTTDFSLNGPIDFKWQRSYHSNLTDSLSMGLGWTHPLTERLDLDQRIVRFYTQTGRVIKFQQPGIGQSFYSRTEKLFIKRQGDLSYRITSLNGDSKLFRADGLSKYLHLVEIRDTNNNCINIDYRQGSPSQIICSWGRELSLQCNDQGLITEIKSTDATCDENPNGILASYAYDDQNQLIEAADIHRYGECYQYDQNILSQRTLCSGAEMHIEWSELSHKGQCLRHYLNDGQEEYRYRWHNSQRKSHVSDPCGRQYSYHYDHKGRITEHTDPTGAKTLYFFDRYGNLCSHTNALGASSYFRHDDQGRLTRYTNALGHTTFIRYTQQGWLNLITDPQGHYWHREYDLQGNLITAKNPEGSTWVLSYNNRGQLEKITDPELGQYKFNWDSKFNLTDWTSPTDQQWQFEADTWGRTLVEIAPNEQRSQFSYNTAGLLLKVQLPLDVEFHYEYNRLRQLVCYQEPSGAKHHWQYGTQGLPLEYHNSTGAKLTYHYHADTQLAAIHSNASETPLYQLQYGKNKQLKTLSLPYGRHLNYRYDPAGQLVELRDMDVVSHNIYDELGQLKQKSNNSGDYCDFHYDTNGRITAINNNDCQIRFQYNAAGLLTSEHADASDHPGLSLKHKYDARGWRTKTVTDEFLLLNQFTASGDLYGIDFNGEPILRAEQDKAGNNIKLVMGDSTRYQTFNTINQLTHAHLEHKQSDQPQLSSDFSYQGFSPEKTNTTSHQQLIEFNTDNGSIQTNWPSPQRWLRDPQKNLIGLDLLQDQEVRHFVAEHTDNNQLHSLLDTVFGYDPRGNIVQLNKTNTQEKWVFNYNGWNQLTSIESGDFKTFYRYDGLGRRISKNVTHMHSKQQQKTSFQWTGQQLWSEIKHNPKGSEIRRYIYQPQTTTPLALLLNTNGNDKSTVYYYQLDNQNRPLAMTDSQGQTVWQVSYNLWGAISQHHIAPQVINTMRQNGDFYDQESGLQLSGQRMLFSDYGLYLQPTTNINPYLPHYQYDEVKNESTLSAFYSTPLRFLGNIKTELSSRQNKGTARYLFTDKNLNSCRASSFSAKMHSKDTA